MTTQRGSRERTTEHAVARCPQCGGALAQRGQLPLADSFAGRQQDTPFPPSLLMACPRCHLQLRWPRSSPAELNAWYEAGAEDSWTVDPHSRRDWHLAAGWVRDIEAQSVLDVGCFDGGFLDLLPTVSRRSGIEIQPDAAARASARGIDVVASDYGALGAITAGFDCVTAFDVLEHSVDPAELLGQMAGAVHPGGYVLVATGNTDSFTWRLMGSRYWYCWPAEHVSFVNPGWCALTGERYGLHVERVQTFSHGGDGSFTSVAETVKNLAYRVAPKPLARVRRMQAERAGATPRRAIVESPPSWMSARDHILVLMRRDS